MTKKSPYIGNSKPRPLPTQDRLNEVLRYQPDTGLLFWQWRPLSAFADSRQCKAWNRRYAFHEAFTAEGKHRHRVGQIDGVCYLAHRIIWKMEYGEDPACIDHIDRDPSNNRLLNLRSVDHETNMRNASHPTNPTSGLNGIYPTKSGNWEAQLRLHGKRIRLGTFPTKKEALEARNRAKAKHWPKASELSIRPKETAA
jgi:hypothetical protein